MELQLAVLLVVHSGIAADSYSSGAPWQWWRAVLLAGEKRNGSGRRNNKKKRKTRVTDLGFKREGEVPLMTWRRRWK